jgi:hypothetical protein
LIPVRDWHDSEAQVKAVSIHEPVTEMLHSRDKPVLFVDIDGVVSLFGFPSDAVPPRCVWHQVDGIIHLLSHEAADHLLALCDAYELVWCSGWEDRANDHLPHLLGLGPFPHLVLGARTNRPAGHWKLAAIEAHAGDRPLAWVDDDVNDAARDWARRRRAPTVIVETEPATGLTEALTERLRAWAQALG